MSQEVLRRTEQNMKNARKALSRALGGIRARRANASLLEGVNVSYYGARYTIKPTCTNFSSRSTYVNDYTI